MRKDIKLYFNEAEHKYIDSLGNNYTSATTKIGEYYKAFDTKAVARACEIIGKNPKHPKYLKYKGKTATQLEAEWNDTTEISLVRGNGEHNYLEDSVNFANGFKRYKVIGERKINNLSYNQIYTVNDVLTLGDTDYGTINIDALREQKLHLRYPTIYRDLVALAANGYKFYPEVVIFDPDTLICGMIDLLAVKGNHFMILDWKTNKGDIRYESGYYDKDNDGNMLTTYIKTNKRFNKPIAHLPASTGYKYALQLSLYAFYVEKLGLKHQANVIYHITHNKYSATSKEGMAGAIWKVKVLEVPYLKRELVSIDEDIYLKNGNKNNQFRMYF